MSVFTGSLQREWQRLRANRWDGAMVSWIPLLTLALLCWIFSAGQPYRLPIAVWNQDHSSLSRQLVRMLEATPGLHVQQVVLDASEAADALHRMQVYGVVHIPPGLERDVKRGASATVTLMHNAQLATTSSLLQRDVQQVVGTLSAGVEIQARAKRGEPQQVVQVRMEPVSTKLVALFNVSTNYEFFLATALIPALVHILAMTAGAWNVGRELRDRTLGAWLNHPGGAGQTLAALLGKLAWPALSLWGCGMLSLLYLAVVRGWPVAGSAWWMALGLMALVMVSLAAGAV
ncbi:MAG: ABC transporter permease, partial [Comamonas sp.]